MSDWTPGPWRVEDRFNEMWGVVIDADAYDSHAQGGGMLAMDGGDKEPQISNARLIALAPEMAELLERCQTSLPVPLEQDVVALLARARGEA